jgi:hypothetical protein
MIYLKSYCYSKHELPFVIANLTEGYDFIDKLILYEYNFTHTGIKKEYEMEKVIHLVPEKLKSKLDYRKIDLTQYNEYAYLNEPGNPKIHNINEPIQRSWLYNDLNYNLEDNDIIIDHDIDEIVYSYAYPGLLKELEDRGVPLSIKMNQFFFKNNYLWKNLIFKSPTIYKYSMVKNRFRNIKGLKIKNLRDIFETTSDIHGCHMSWVMPIDYMLKKFDCYSHPEYRKFANREKLTEAIEKKQYVFDLNRPFEIDELNIDDRRIPESMRMSNPFDYLESFEDLD